jgi:malonate transporter and related proteins
LFIFTARAPIDDVLNWAFIAAFLLGTLGTLLISFVVGRIAFGHNLSTLTLQGFTAVFANTAYMGIPIFLTAYGTDGALPAIVATFAGIFILVGGVIAILESVRAKGPSVFDICREVSGALVRNPLLIAPILGILHSYLALPVPTPVGNFLDLMAASAGPAALFALGLSLVGRPLLGDMAKVSWVIMLKLIIHPALTFVLVRYVFDLDPVWGNAAIILSTALSIVTLSGLLVILASADQIRFATSSSMTSVAPPPTDCTLASRVMRSMVLSRI